MSIMDRYAQSVKKLDNVIINEYIDLLNALQNKEKLEVLIAGELSNGKSTFINFFLKRDYLPTGIGATTAKLTYISKDKHNYIKSDGKKYDLDLNKNDDEIKKNIENIMNENKDSKVYLYLKDFPFDDITFIDTPGVNDTDKKRELLTYQYAPFSDIVIFVADIAKGLSSLEKNFFDNIDDSIKNKIFVLFNKIDLFMEYNDKQPEKYLNELNINNIKSYGISAYQAFESIANNDDELRKISNIDTFMEDLFSYMKSTNKSKDIKNRSDKILKRIDYLSNIQLDKAILIYDKDISLLEAEYKEIDARLKRITKEYEESKIQLDNETNILKEKTTQVIKDFSLQIQNKLNSITHIDEKIEFFQSDEFSKDCDSFSEDILSNFKDFTESLSISKIEVGFMDNILIKIDDRVLEFLSLLPIGDLVIKGIKVKPALEKAIPWIKKTISYFRKNKLENKINSYLEDMFKEVNKKVNHLIETTGGDIVLELKKEMEKQQTQKIALKAHLDIQKNKLEDKKISQEYFIELKNTLNDIYKEMNND